LAAVRSNAAQIARSPKTHYSINYNIPHGDGWYLISLPIITADWLAGQQWTVPFGGGLGRVFRIGDQPINTEIQAFYNVVRPDEAAHWQFR
jgi:hypothetical protein